MNQLILPQLPPNEWDFMSDQLAQINISDSELYLLISFENQKFKCHYLGPNKQQSKVTLSITSYDAIEMAKQEVDPDTLFFQRKLKIQGDTALAHQLKNTLDNLALDSLPKIFIKGLDVYQAKILSSH